MNKITRLSLGPTPCKSLRDFKSSFSSFPLCIRLISLAVSFGKTAWAISSLIAPILVLMGRVRLICFGVGEDPI
jgi:hypothetical protein